MMIGRDGGECIDTDDCLRPPSSGSEYVYPLSSLFDSVLTKFKSDRVMSGKSCYFRKECVSIIPAELLKFVTTEWPEAVVVQNVVNGRDMFIFPDALLWADMDDAMMDIKVTGDKDTIDHILYRINKAFDAAGSYVRWIYDPQYMESMNVSLSNKNQPFDEMYPFLGDESLADYYDRYMASDASILVLLGNPGLGKTSFIRGLLTHTNQNAMLTYHQKLLEQDSFFAEWFKTHDHNILVIEDADTMLAPRSDGNQMMDRFLNLGDGLITIKGKKMIFTTNLPNVSSIDEALLRPGRCHDVIEFKNLTTEQANKVAKKAGVEFTATGDSHTVASIFADTKRNITNKPKAKFGFIQ